MGHKSQPHGITRNQGEPLADFGVMPVARYALGLEVVAGFSKEGAHFGFASRAGNAGLGIRY